METKDKMTLKVGDDVIVIDDKKSSGILHNGDTGIIIRITYDMYNIKWDSKKNAVASGGWFIGRFKKFERRITNWRERIG